MKATKLIFKTFVLSLLVIAQVHFAYAQTASILPPAKTTFLDQNGKPLAKGKVYFYTPGTTTQKTTWQDSGETTPNTNPVVLDSSGRGIILGDGSYRQQVFDKNGNLIWDQQTASGGGSGGGGTPTVGDGASVGTIKPWPGFVAPFQYVFAYGQELPRTSFPSLFSTLTTQQNVSCTSGSATLTGLSDTSQIPVGAKIESVCLNAGATVVSTTISTITASSTAIISTSSTARIFPFDNGDGSTTFNVPDLRGRVLAGRDNMGGIAASRLTSAATGCGVTASLGANCGNQSQTLTLAQLPTGITSANTGGISLSVTTSQKVVNGPNQGSATAGGSQVTAADPGSGGALSTVTSTGTIAISSAAVTSNNTSGTAHPIVQPTGIVNYIIKTLPDTNANTFFGVASIGGMTGVITCGTGLTCSGNNISAVTSAIPAPTIATLGGVFSVTCSTHNWFNSLDTTGTFGCSQPNFTDLAGSIATGQIPTNTITDTQLAQGAALSIVGNGTNATANKTDIVATAASSCVYRENASTVACGSINLAASGAVGSSILGLANGGTNANLTASNGGIYYSNATQAQILAGTATARLPLLSGSSTAPVWAAYTMPSSITSGGILCFTSTTAMTSSVLQTLNAIMIGGGAGACPSPLASLGTTTTVLHGNTSGSPSFASVAYADIGSSSLATQANYFAGAANTIVPTSIIYTTETTTTYGLTTTFDFSTFINTAVTLTGNITTMTLSNVKAGQAGQIRFIQDATGSRTTVWNSIFKFAGGITPALSTAANSVDALEYNCSATNYCVASILLNVK